MESVKSVGAHVMRETAGAADAGNHHGLFGRQLLIARQALHRVQHRMIAATGTPARPRRPIIFELHSARRLNFPFLFLINRWLVSFTGAFLTSVQPAGEAPPR